MKAVVVDAPNEYSVQDLTLDPPQAMKKTETRRIGAKAALNMAPPSETWAQKVYQGTIGVSTKPHRPCGRVIRMFSGSRHGQLA